MDARRTPERPVPGIPRHTPDPTLERGFVASLRWLVAEGDARGVRRIAVELRALREALTTLDETRRARDEQAARALQLGRELEEAAALLGEATRVEGEHSLADRLRVLREVVQRDVAARRAIGEERDAWRAMCEWMTRTRAHVHRMLEEAEQARETLAAEAGTLRERVTVLAEAHREAATEASARRRRVTELETQLAKATRVGETLRDRVRTAETELATLAMLEERVRHADRDRVLAESLRERLRQTEREREIAQEAADRATREATTLRRRLRSWTDTVEQAVADLARAAGGLAEEARREADARTESAARAEEVEDAWSAADAAASRDEPHLVEKEGDAGGLAIVDEPIPTPTATPVAAPARRVPARPADRAGTPPRSVVAAIADAARFAARGPAYAGDELTAGTESAAPAPPLPAVPSPVLPSVAPAVDAAAAVATVSGAVNTPAAPRDVLPDIDPSLWGESPEDLRPFASAAWVDGTDLLAGIPRDAARPAAPAEAPLPVEPGATPPSPVVPGSSEVSLPAISEPEDRPREPWPWELGIDP